MLEVRRFDRKEWRRRRRGPTENKGKEAPTPPRVVVVDAKKGGK